MNLRNALSIHLASLQAGHADFEDTMALVERYFDYQPTAFDNGPLHNAAGQNEGSCKLFAMAQQAGLTEDEALKCFGRHYQSVLDDPAGDSHGNIRQFMSTGWSGIRFAGSPLHQKTQHAPSQEESL